MKDAVFDDFIDRLRSESDIVSIISDYVSLKKKGKNYWGCCPFHSEKTPSFSVTPDKGFFYCFGCQTGGNVFNFLMKVENITFFEAAKLLAKKLNVPLPEKEKTPRELAKEQEIAKIYHVNELARDFFHACLTKTNYGKPAREYLANRGIADEIIDFLKLGFAPPSWDKLSATFMEQRGIAPDILLKAGLAAPRNSGDGVYDRFRNRIMFPINDVRGRTIGFGGRVLDNSQPKYLNSPETEIFNKRHVLYGFDIAYQHIRNLRQVVIVEGYMDAITLYTQGIRNVVASLGTAFTPDQARNLIKLNAELLFSYDSDAAGQNATVRALDTVRTLGATIKVITIPDGKDPDEFVRKHGSQSFQGLLESAKPLLDYQLDQALKSDDYSTVQGKIAVVGKLAPILAEADNAVAVNAHITRLSQVLAVDESALRTEITKYIVQTKKDKNVKMGKTINIALLYKQPAPAVIQAERQLIRLMCDDLSLVPYVLTNLSPQEIQGTLQQEIINFIFNAYNMEKNISQAAFNAGVNSLSEKASSEFSHIMLMENEFDDEVKLIDDCIKTIRLAHLTALYEQHRLMADELERMGDSNFLQELAESQRIKHEISKLHH
ncbi:DNA primase [Sporomusa acidovorans]|uniref:DNA primase n=1 Tax=Sporomusa acidovorans (strain ATCC 49682 / DSM 3132 / Mol) TaxID=1123286 RepID=A0ABZ3J4J2_SPOA4|nr:DNA primase [Sporomusa acidovorans]OZC20955.1 DNA primase [Sporomusa acidovorans DSM 3132]SDE62320.1 DNA primase [Sporomusa acidovorans]